MRACFACRNLIKNHARHRTVRQRNTVFREKKVLEQRGNRSLLPTSINKAQASLSILSRLQVQHLGHLIFPGPDLICGHRVDRPLELGHGYAPSHLAAADAERIGSPFLLAGVVDPDRMDYRDAQILQRPARLVHVSGVEDRREVDQNTEPPRS